MSTHADVPHGTGLLNRPGLNKGTAFTDDERSTFGLHGLLPPQLVARRHREPLMIPGIVQEPANEHAGIEAER